MEQRNDIEGLRVKLEGTRGREYWRSLESLAETPEFKEFLHREFPQNASEWLDPVGRRGFLKLMGASLALAGVSACTRQPDEEIVPYVRQPEEEVPGKPLFFATAMPMSGAGLGLLVESHEGRPTKVEGNPDHPSSRGATDLYAQASILGLYDPDRSRNLTNLGDIFPFSAFSTAIRGLLQGQEAGQGAGIRILTETVASPTLAAQMREFLAKYPQAKWIQWEPAGRHNARAGSQLAFGEYVDASMRSRRRTSSCRSTPTFSAPAHQVCGIRARSRRAVVLKATRLSSIDCTRSKATPPTPAREPIIACRSRRARSKLSLAPSLREWV
jgi:molybdopterin-containing oxidoreductase family iron-sulfur binding subunit